jgi:hypothetical protein
VGSAAVAGSGDIGGMKQSGLGREFGVEGLRAFYELQAVHRVSPLSAT